MFFYVFVNICLHFVRTMILYSKSLFTSIFEINTAILQAQAR